MQPSLPPEIIPIILQHVDHNTLFSVVRVNRLWAEEGLSLLWHSQTSVQALLSVPPSRRQYYADKIRNFEVNQDTICENEHRNGASSFGLLQFPKLQHVKIDYFYYPSSISQYLQPELLSFGWHGASKVVEDVFGMLSTRCPALRSIFLDAEFPNSQPDDLLRFLEASTSLKSIKLHSDVNPLVTTDILAHLASRDRLYELLVTRPFSDEEIQSSLDMVKATPFRRLKRISIVGYAAGLAGLLAHLDASLLNGLSLLVVDAAGPILNHFARFVNLQELEVSIQADTTFAIHDILMLRSLKRLNALTIQGYYAVLQSPPWTDEQMTLFFSSFPDLDSLAFQVQANLSVAALIALKTSSKLRSCHLTGGFALATLEVVDGPIFPALEVLHLSRILDGDGTVTPDHQASLIARHAPRLQELELTSFPADLADEVMRCFERQGGSRDGLL
ncbi:hypothetical protein K461DRAFT_295464 [Myriangium duriaei CBS 260.36]|uniref:F-box domain-containing protein n=1 Tax=Myriangium duriaei CBS 260.36 TaxID=1168546 RepID=A0A9P4MFR1_9PEZI|nr:hypothetical protein K461DRAFT_295464 [Myriangium duriaei CBS 260.36]